MRPIFFVFSAFLFITLYFVGDLTSWENAAVCLFVYFLLNFLNNLGNRVAILDLTIIMGCVTCLLLPVIFYHVYTKENMLARMWLKYMPISSDDYFSFAVPGIVAIALGIRMPLMKLKYRKTPGVYLEKVKVYLTHNPRLGLILMAIGVISGLLDFLAPASLREIFFLMAHLIFVGVFYVIYSPSKNKKWIVTGVITLLLGESILTGMFGELIFILACSIVIIFLGKKTPYYKKLLFACIGIFSILIIQSIKGEYRKRSWSEGSGADPLYFTELVAEKVSDPLNMLDQQGMFVTAVRMNQGWLVATTMKMVPAKYPFGNGEPLWEAIAASVVPRFLWPDKPEAGGKANLKRFWGFDLIGWSTNIGTLGEAYANFDRTGGLVYLFVYGLFFNLILSTFLKMAERRPTLILWLPYLFFSAINVETDLLSTMGILIKGTIFIWIMFKVFHHAFNMEL
jgi:hypothetical protein